MKELPLFKQQLENMAEELENMAKELIQPGSLESEINSQKYSNKVLKLVDLLRAMYGPEVQNREHCGLVFVERICFTRPLVHILSTSLNVTAAAVSGVSSMLETERAENIRRFGSVLECLGIISKILFSTQSYSVRQFFSTFLSSSNYVRSIPWCTN